MYGKISHLFATEPQAYSRKTAHKTNFLTFSFSFSLDSAKKILALMVRWDQSQVLGTRSDMNA